MPRKTKICFLILALLVISLLFKEELKLKTANEVPKLSNNSAVKENKTSKLKYLDSKYSLDDMYNLISNREIPDDDEFYDILLNWFDYYSEDNLFLNSFGEEFNKNEYQKIKKAFSDNTLKVLLVNVKKSWFIPVLDK